GGGAVRGKLDLDPALVRRARQLARRAGRPVVDLARGHTTISVERSVLRLAGLSGADPEQTPWVNRLVDAVAADVDLAHGVALPVFDALLREGGGQSDPAAALFALAQKAGAGSVRFTLPAGRRRSGVVLPPPGPARRRGAPQRPPRRGRRDPADRSPPGAAAAPGGPVR